MTTSLVLGPFRCPHSAVLCELMPSLAAYTSMMRRDRERLGLRECRAAWLLGRTVRQYRALEAGDDSVLVGQV